MLTTARATTAVTTTPPLPLSLNGMKECFVGLQQSTANENAAATRIINNCNSASKSFYGRIKNDGIRVEFNDHPEYMRQKNQFEQNIRDINEEYQKKIDEAKKQSAADDLELGGRMSLSLDNTKTLEDERDKKTLPYKKNLHELFGKMITESQRISFGLQNLMQQMVDTSYKNGEPIKSFALFSPFDRFDHTGQHILIGFAERAGLFHSEVKPVLSATIDSDGHVLEPEALYFEYGQRASHDTVERGVYDPARQSGISISYFTRRRPFISIFSTEPSYNRLTSVDIVGSNYGMVAPSPSRSVLTTTPRALAANVVNHREYVNNSAIADMGVAITNDFMDKINDVRYSTKYLKTLLPSVAAAIICAGVGYVAGRRNSNNPEKQDVASEIALKFLQRCDDYQLTDAEKSELSSLRVAGNGERGGELREDEITRFKLAKVGELCSAMGNYLPKIQLQNLKVLSKMINDPKTKIDDFIEQYNKYAEPILCAPAEARSLLSGAVKLPDATPRLSVQTQNEVQPHGQTWGARLKSCFSGPFGQPDFA